MLFGIKTKKDKRIKELENEILRLEMELDKVSKPPVFNIPNKYEVRVLSSKYAVLHPSLLNENFVLHELALSFVGEIMKCMDIKVDPSVFGDEMVYTAKLRVLKKEVGE